MFLPENEWFYLLLPVQAILDQWVFTGSTKPRTVCVRTYMRVCMRTHKTNEYKEEPCSVVETKEKTDPVPA